ncbi:amidohydrolase family protein [Nocardioides sp. YIM 152315]|uniref:amidohydrolase family protein n=1 Tax=Nocardioides sp. YIM 152315 TaxID=3031760 RepID=UPI0023DC6E8D|nr:amidohydrolase family protein [Nocardioides sp. YIM 152315]MDF1605285.1 amidohydrolase family protein [Nocardioides sp. YIM 152315]
MPDAVIDAHVHWWRLSEHDWYPALPAWADALPPGVGDGFNRDFDPLDYRAAAPFEARGFVHVSAVTTPRTYLDELAWVEAQAEAHDLDVRIVGTVDPTLSDAELRADLDRQAESPRFAGVRVLYGFEPGSPAASSVLTWLAAHDKVFDLVCHPRQVDAWLRALSAHPDLRVVLEHTGWPESADDLGAWRDGMRRLASETTMSCKVSGLGMALMDVSVETLRPWVETAVDEFGLDRLLFGSNIPIETMAGSFARLVASLEEILAGAPTADLDSFWSANAAAAYGF